MKMSLVLHSMHKVMKNAKERSLSTSHMQRKITHTSARCALINGTGQESNEEQVPFSLHSIHYSGCLTIALILIHATMQQRHITNQYARVKEMADGSKNQNENRKSIKSYRLIFLLHQTQTFFSNQIETKASICTQTHS